MPSPSTGIIAVFCFVLPRRIPSGFVSKPVLTPPLIYTSDRSCCFTVKLLEAACKYTLLKHAHSNDRKIDILYFIMETSKHD